MLALLCDASMAHTEFSDATPSRVITQTTRSDYIRTMMQQFVDEYFKRFHDRDSGAEFRSLEFINCEFDNCFVSITNDPRLRSTVRNVCLTGCRARANCTLGCAIVEDATVDGLKCLGGPLRLQGSVYKHVVLKGPINNLMLTGSIAWEEDIRQAFNAADAEYYESVDWALDIAEADFRRIDIRGIPTHLIRRDPETQGILRREALQDERWKTIRLNSNLFPTSMAIFWQSGLEDELLIAPKAAPNFSDLRDDLRRLRAEGIVEPG